MSGPLVTRCTSRGEGYTTTGRRSCNLIVDRGWGGTGSRSFLYNPSRTQRFRGEDVRGEGPLQTGVTSRSVLCLLFR